MARQLDDFKFRARILLVALFLISGLLAGRLFFIQVLEHEWYKNLAERQYTSYASKPSVAVRGDIYFKEKNGQLISAASIKEGYLAAVNPQIVNDPGFLCEKLGEVVALDFQTCFKRASKQDDPFEVVANRVDQKDAKKIDELDIKGLDTYPEQWRFGPGGSLASHVLGFVGYHGHELVGRYGVEQNYESILKGESEKVIETESFAALFLNLGKEFLGSSDIYNGQDLVLTIEPKVQTVLEKRLFEIMEEWQPESAGGIVINPQTGAVLAMAARPDFNPNRYYEVENIALFRNPLISDVFELGSVFKPLTLASGLDSSAILKNSTYVDNGYVIVEGVKIENYDGEARGKVDMQQVLNQSLNTGAVYIMKQMGKDVFKKYMTNFGLGEKTGIDLSDEAVGNISNLSSPRQIEAATASFGQGVAVTPIEFVSAVSALANGGEVMQPYVLERVLVDMGEDRVTEPKIRNRVLSKETSKEITRMLVSVVDDALLGGTVKMNHYSIAAKTGTAQIPNKEGEGYEEGQYLHSFFGYGPAFDAKFLIFLYVEKPQGVKYASQTLTRPFVDIMKFLLNYYQILPDR